MLAIGNYSWLTFIILVALSLVPVIYFIGKVFTRSGRSSIAASPVMFLYFIIYFIYAYFFWLSPYLIEEFIGMGDLYQKMVYGALCVVPFFEKDIPN